MHSSFRLILSLVAVGTLSACGTITEPQTYFSTVFEDAEAAYRLTQNETGHVLGNYLADVTLTRNQVETSYTFAFYEGGMQRTRTSGNQQLVITYDYGNQGGVFTQSSSTQSGDEGTKTFSPFTSTTLSRYLSVLDELDATLTEGVRGIITAQATNLLIGGQATNLEWKTYTLPIDTFINSYAPFEVLTGFLPTSVDVVVRYQSTSKALEITLDAEHETETFSLEATLSSPDQVDASEYALTLEEKATYSGFSA